jgi:hypothetical protein
MSVFRAMRVGDHGRHDYLLEGRDGAGDESTGSHFAGHGEEDHVVVRSGDHRHQRPADAALARAILTQGNYGAKGTPALPSGPASLAVTASSRLFTATIVHNNPPAGVRYLLQYSKRPTSRVRFLTSWSQPPGSAACRVRSFVSAWPPNFPLPPSHPGCMRDRQLRPRSSVNV